MRDFEEEIFCWKRLTMSFHSAAAPDSMYESSAYSAHSVSSSNLPDKKPLHLSASVDENMSDDEQVNFINTNIQPVSGKQIFFGNFQMVIAEPTSSAEVAEVDLKCAEKVTDSDVEESNLDSEDTQKAKVPNLNYL